MKAIPVSVWPTQAYNPVVQTAIVFTLLLATPRYLIAAAAERSSSGNFALDIGKSNAGWVTPYTSSATVSTMSKVDKVEALSTKGVAAADDIGEARDYAKTPAKSASTLRTNSAKPTDDEIQDITCAYLQGSNASSTVAESWEAILRNDPDQRVIRESLIGFYMSKRFNEPAAKARYSQHVLYVISHYPESPYAGSFATLFLISGIDSAADCAAAEKLWLAHTEAKPRDVRILVNASSFLAIGNEAAAERLLKQAQLVEPKNPELHAQLGSFYLRQAITKDVQAKYAAASKALAETEKARSLIPDENGRLQLMDELVRASYVIGRYDKTKSYAGEWMKKAPVGDSEYSRAQHYGHTALGLIALQTKDLKSAKDHLAMSADHNGSPDLNSFGPCMDLAAALMDQGQKDAVADYLEACGKFWKLGEKPLAEWNKVLEAGNRPDFSGHFSF